MLYIETINTVFILPQKCASSSIKKEIRRAFDIGEKNKFWEQDYQTDNTDGKITVACVRNPFDRLVSCYLDQSFGKDRYKLGANHSFEEFVDYVVRQSYKNADKHFKPFYMTVPERVTFLMRYETLKADWDQVRKCFPVFEPLPRINSMQRRVHWSDYYNKQTLNRVYNYYIKDFERYGY